VREAELIEALRTSTLVFGTVFFSNIATRQARAISSSSKQTMSDERPRYRLGRRIYHLRGVEPVLTPQDITKIFQCSALDQREPFYLSLVKIPIFRHVFSINEKVEA
jgi:hypothetical protein